MVSDNEYMIAEDLLETYSLEELLEINDIEEVELVSWLIAYELIDPEVVRVLHIDTDR